VATWDVDTQGFPALVTADYIDLPRIARVSLFRSSMGHDYRDSFEGCLSSALSAGDAVTAGQPLGTHVGPQTSSDVAVAVDDPAGRRLISYFEVMADAVWAGYAARGVEARRALIISRAERDADALACDGERFVTAGTLPQTREL
jgi:hypothetical protein